jgi:hypothetical protein
LLWPRPADRLLNRRHDAGAAPMKPKLPYRLFEKLVFSSQPIVRLDPTD